MAQKINTLSGNAIRIHFVVIPWLYNLNEDLSVMDKTWEFFLIDPAKPTGIEDRICLQYLGDYELRQFLFMTINLSIKIWGESGKVV